MVEPRSAVSAALASHPHAGMEVCRREVRSAPRQVAALAAIATGIASSARHQATSLGEINASIRQMHQVTQQNAAMVEQSTAANRALAGEADALQALMAQFRTSEVTKLRQVRQSAAKAAHPAPRRAASRPLLHSRDGSAARKLAPAADEQSWEEF